MPSRFKPDVLEKLTQVLLDIRDRAIAFERSFESELASVAPEYRASARNLLHYLALRQHDLRDPQRELSSFGLSSLGRSEAHTLAGLDAVLAVLHRLANRPMERGPKAVPPVDFSTGPEMLTRHAEALLGRSRPERAVRIMVTMPTEAAEDIALIRDLIKAGMDVMRINCAHDDLEAWGRMASHLRRAQQELNQPCRLLVDLGGPKLRTGEIVSSGAVARWAPRRDIRGKVKEPARVWLTPANAPERPPTQADAVLPLETAFLCQARSGDELHFVDCRGVRRVLVFGSRQGSSCWAQGIRSAYVEAGIPLRLVRAGTMVAQGRLGALAPVIEPIVLHVGEGLILTRADEPGHPAQRTAEGVLVQPAQIPCTLPEVFRDVRPGERIFFDDGKIGGVIERVEDAALTVKITRARPGGSKLRADKGINLPESELRVPALTGKDLADLDFAVSHADMVGLSFVQDPEDVLLLEERLAQRAARHDIGILLKIETRKAFENLSRLILTGLRSPPIGVMVARGDLGVELGFERLAEVQEEILWVCEAAHVPVIWATQVLESLAKKGMPSRAEVTDAAMAGRAECVMLNKGPHIVETVEFLDNVLRRMQDHQAKKRALLRKLTVSELASNTDD